MTKEKLEQALEKIGSTIKYGWTAYSNVAYTIVENILTEWLGSFDSYETHLEDDIDYLINEELDTAFIFYKDVYGYLEQRNVWDIEDAVREGFGDNLGSIAYYFLQDEIYSLLSDLDLY